MNRIIWDPQSLERIMAQLRNASEELAECQSGLRTALHNGEEIFKENRGLSNKVLTAISDAAKKAGQLAERTDSLYGSMRRVRDMVTETEASVRGMMEGKDMSRATLPGAGPSGGITSVFYANMAESVTGIVPQWLQDAANQSFPV